MDSLRRFQHFVSSKLLQNAVFQLWLTRWNARLLKMLIRENRMVDQKVVGIQNESNALGLAGLVFRD
jgi:hypothetical protein